MNMRGSASRARTNGWIVAGVIAASLACLLTPPLALGQEVADQPRPVGGTADHAWVASVERVGFTVSDLDRSVEFFTSVLDFVKEDEGETAGIEIERLSGVFGSRVRTARLRLGQERIELTQYLAPEGRAIPQDTRNNDRWFQHIAIVVRDMDRAYARLREHRVRHASTGPQTLPSWNKDAGGISAFYFKDPDGHHLEIIHFPAGKGDPRWQEPGAELFQGIDHTAIVVRDTEASLRFYRDTLGMRVAGGAENYGTEQEHLNNVFGARLRITALRAEHGPGIELLEYLAPTTGRAYPVDSHANDLWHWQTTLVTPTLEEMQARTRAARVDWISPGIVSGVQRWIGLPSASMVRDPDGHAIVLAASQEVRGALPESAPSPSASK